MILSRPYNLTKEHIECMLPSSFNQFKKVVFSLRLLISLGIPK